jgi:hypothetical protein
VGGLELAWSQRITGVIPSACASRPGNSPRNGGITTSAVESAAIPGLSKTHRCLTPTSLCLFFFSADAGSATNIRFINGNTLATQQLKRPPLSSDVQRWTVSCWFICPKRVVTRRTARDSKFLVTDINKTCVNA